MKFTPPPPSILTKLIDDLIDGLENHVAYEGRDAQFEGLAESLLRVIDNKTMRRALDSLYLAYLSLLDSDGVRFRHRLADCRSLAKAALTDSVNEDFNPEEDSYVPHEVRPDDLSDPEAADDSR